MQWHPAKAHHFSGSLVVDLYIWSFFEEHFERYDPELRMIMRQSLSGHSLDEYRTREPWDWNEPHLQIVIYHLRKLRSQEKASNLSRCFFRWHSNRTPATQFSFLTNALDLRRRKPRRSAFRCNWSVRDRFVQKVNHVRRANLICRSFNLFTECNFEHRLNKSERVRYQSGH